MKAFSARCALFLWTLALFSGWSHPSAAAAAQPSDYPAMGLPAAEGPVAVPEPSEKALTYYRSGNALWCVYTAWALFLPALLLFTGASARIRDLALRWSRHFYVRFLIFLLIVLGIAYLTSLPLDFYRGFVRPHAFGLSNQSLTKWVGDSLKGLILQVLVGALFLWVPFLLAVRSPRRWWLYTGILSLPFLFFSMLLTPIFVDPLFNQFGPMKDRALESRIAALAEKSGIEGGRIFEVDKSTDTKTINAYVSGWLGSKRIVLWDTIIERLKPEELLFVMGHEMGHYVLGHVWKGLLVFAALILLALWGVHLAAPPILQRWQNRIGMVSLADFAALPLAVLLLNLFSLALTPIGYAYSRYQEREADRFGLELTRNNRAAAEGFVKLQIHNLGNPRPGPLFVAWRSTHPPAGERIDFANRYRPWANGEPIRYERYFKGPIPSTNTSAAPNR